MSHWGKYINASNIFYISILIYIIINYIYIIYIYIIKKYNIIDNITNKKDIINSTGPLNIDIISIIYGSLLGNGYGKKIKGGKGTRIIIQQEYCNSNYLYYLHSLLANLGYCNTNLPIIKTKLSKKGKIIKYLKLKTWTYESFNYIFSEWYIKNLKGFGFSFNFIKVIPKSLELYLTPLALAIWIIDDGCKLDKSLKFITNYFSYDDVKYLTYLLLKKYNIKSTIHKCNKENTQFIIYISVESIPILANIVSPYIIPSIKYKLGKYLL